MPLCHWPCSCYPNHALGQTNDWMAEIYPRWVAAHGIFIACPVNWYQAPAGLKLMKREAVPPFQFLLVFGKATAASRCAS